MAAWVHDLIKTDLKDIIYEAFETAIKERGWLEIDREDFNKFLRAIRIKQVESDGECSRSGQRKVSHSTNNSGHQSHGGGESREESSSSACTSISFHSHRIHLCIQGDYGIRRRYSYSYHGDSLSYNSSRGSFDSGRYTTLKGVILGSALGSAVIGGSTGMIAGGVIGGVLGSAATSRVAVAGAYALRDRFLYRRIFHSVREHETVEAVEVFQKLDEFSVDRNRNMCYCVITKNTVCPYQECTSETIGERVWRSI